MTARASERRAATGAGSPALVDTVYDAVVGMLLDQRIAPGAPVRTEALGATLGVSATPVREALTRLETTGLVVRSAHRGWSAAPALARADIVHVVEARLVLEPENARLACERADDALRAELARFAAEQAAAPVGPGYADYREFVQADWNFHLAIATHTGNPYLEKAFMSVNGYLQRYLLFGHEGITDAAQSVAEHAAVLDAFQRRSPEIAAAAMRDHMLRLRDRVRSPAADAGAEAAADGGRAPGYPGNLDETDSGGFL